MLAHKMQILKNKDSFLHRKDVFQNLHIAQLCLKISGSYKIVYTLINKVT